MDEREARIRNAFRKIETKDGRLRKGDIFRLLTVRIRNAFRKIETKDGRLRKGDIFRLLTVRIRNDFRKNETKDGRLRKGHIFRLLTVSQCCGARAALFGVRDATYKMVKLEAGVVTAKGSGSATLR